MIYFLTGISALLCTLLHSWQRFIELFPRERTFHYQPEPAFVRKTLIRCFFKKQKSDDLEESTQRKIALLKGFKSFFLSFAIAGGLFSLLQLWLDASSHSAFAETTILGIEKSIKYLKEKTEIFEKIGFIPDVLITIILIVLAGSWVLIAEYDVRKRYKGAVTALGSVIGVLTICSSITFYGNEFRKNEAGVEGKLKIHELEIVEDNKLLVKQIGDEVTERVIKEILSDPAIQEVIKAKDDAQSTAYNIAGSGYYADYKQYENDSAILPLLAAADLDSVIIQGFTSAQEQFFRMYMDSVLGKENERERETPSVDEKMVYDNLGEARYALFRQGSHDWFREDALSEKVIAEQSAIFTKAVQEVIPRSTPLYDKYGEVIEKLIKQGYSVSIKEWVNTSLKATWASIPLLGEILDPLHEMVFDLINDKIKKIFVRSTKGDIKSVSEELGKIGDDVKGIIARSDGVKASYKKWTKIFNSATVKLKEADRRIVEKCRSINASIDNHLVWMKENSRWQGMRDKFAQKARGQAGMLEGLSEEQMRETVRNMDVIIRGSKTRRNSLPNQFSRDQWSKFLKVLSTWDELMKNNKVVWWQNNDNDLDRHFFEYIKNDPMACAAWGFILQHEDWYNGLVYIRDYETEKIGTKPYNFLKYYCAMTRYGSIDEIYTVVTDRRVEELCPR